MQQECDVLIIGGGPAGSSLAWGLKNRGLKVLMMDKQFFPRDKVCAGWVTPDVMDLLDVDIKEYESKNTLQRIDGFRVSSLGMPSVHAQYDSTVSYGIRRYEFDNYLLQRCGAQVLYGQAFKSMLRDGDTWVVNGDIRARLIVGAGGHFCPVAKLLSRMNSDKSQIITAQEIEFKLTDEQKKECRLNPSQPELYFLPDLSGYAWAFRKGNYVNIGLGRENNHKLSEYVQEFVEFLKKKGVVNFDIPVRFKGHAYILQNLSQRNIVDDGVILIGDAVGLAYPQSGEGIRPAVESALIAAKRIIDCKGTYSYSLLNHYRESLYGRFGFPQPNKKDRIPPVVKQWLAKYLLGTKWFSRKVVIEKWFLQRQQPPLSLD